MKLLTAHLVSIASPLHSPARESRKPREFDQILTAKSDTPGPEKPSHGFCSDLSSGSIPSSGPPSRSESPDQGKRRVDALDIEKQRIKERIRKARIELITIQQEMYQSIADTNRACQAAKERVQAEREFAIRDIEVQMNVTNQRIAGITYCRNGSVSITNAYTFPTKLSIADFSFVKTPYPPRHTFHIIISIALFITIS